MNLPFFIAGRIAGKKASGFSRFITRLSVTATALSVAIMVIAVCIVQGYKEKIFDKMFAFWGHFHIAETSANPSTILSAAPIKYDPILVKRLQDEPHIKHIYPFAVKTAIITTNSIIEGIKIKGVDKKYSFENTESIRYDGDPITFTDSGYASQIILSVATLKKLKQHIGGNVQVYFVNAGESVPSIRKLKIIGTYHTGVDEIDQSFAICDINLLCRISGWPKDAINGYEVLTDDFKQADNIAQQVYQQYVEPPLSCNTMSDIYPNISGWLSLIDVNTQVILLIMSIVAIINMATALLIFVMERTNMVGILKSLGMNNTNLWLIFLYQSLRVAVTGILTGGIVGTALCWIQQYTQVLKLNESVYYVSYVPMNVVWWQPIVIMICTILLCLFILMLPALITRKISIVKALRFK